MIITDKSVVLCMVVFCYSTALKRAAEQITVIEPKRARNLGKKFKLRSEYITSAVSVVRLQTLSKRLMFNFSIMLDMHML